MSEHITFDHVKAAMDLLSARSETRAGMTLPEAVQALLCELEAAQALATAVRGYCADVTIPQSTLDAALAAYDKAIGGAT